MARSEGLEPPTPWFEAKYSIQLSYERNEVWILVYFPGFLIYKKLGGPYRIRTYDTEVKSLLLYHLS
jgi:hypothetical protein